MTSLEERAERYRRTRDEDALRINAKAYNIRDAETGEPLYRGDEWRTEPARVFDATYSAEGAHAYAYDTAAPGEGGWYSRFNPQPIEIIEKWNLDHHRASIIQYLVRSDAKGGLEDLLKAKWYLDRLIAIEEAK